VGSEPALLSPTESLLCAEAEGYNVHAHVRIGEGDRPGLERLCRYLLRPPIATERLHSSSAAARHETADGQVVYELKRPWSDGTTHLVFEPLEFLGRLCALVPPARAHLVLYHGVLAAHANWRREIIPLPESDLATAQDGLAQDPGSVPISSSLPAPEIGPRPRRLPWAALLKRVFGLDVLTCPLRGLLRGPRCGGRRKIVAFVTDPSELVRICKHLGLPTEAPPIHPARAPPQQELGFAEAP